MKNKVLLFLSLMLFISFSIKAQELTNWTIGTSDLTVEQETDALLVNDGSNSAKCTWTSTSNQDLNSDFFNVTADANYTYSVDVFDNDNAGKARLVIIFYDDSDAAIDYNYDGYSADNTSYQTVSASGTVPTDATKALIRIRFYDDTDWDGDATVWIDNIVYNDGTNNLLNGSFENWTFSSAPVISDITISPEEPAEGDAVSIGATITDDNSVASATLNWGTESGNLTNTINMTATGVADVFVADTQIPAQAAGTTIYYEIVAEDGDATPNVTTSSEQNYTISSGPQTTILPYTETFDSDLGQTYTYSVSGDTKEWYFDTDKATMNGYNSGDLEEDWLILPGINFDNYTGEIMTFETTVKYGSDDADNYLKLFYSADYTGTGDPSSATWTELTFTQPTEDDVATSSGDIDLSAITGTNVYIAFKYHYNSGSYKRWNVDNISIAEPITVPQISNISINPSSPTSNDDVVVSATITDDVAVISASIYWSTSSPVTVADNSLAMAVASGDIYDGEIPAQAGGTTVYYYIAATDGSKTTTNSEEQSYTVAEDVPTLTITSPTEGSTVETADVDIAFDVTNFSVAVPPAGDGYIVYDIDGTGNTDYYLTTDISLTDLANGSHTMSMKLVDNDGNDLVPAVGDTITFNVYVIPEVTIYDIQYTTVADDDGTYPSLLVDQIVKTAGVVSAVNGSNYFIQDADGAWNGVYVYDGTNTPSVGDSVAITGTVEEHYGLTQLGSITAYEVKTSGETVHAATDVTTLAANEEQYEGVLIKVTGAVCTNADAGYGMWEVNDNSGALLTDDDIFAYTPTANFIYDVTGLGYYSYSAYKILPRDANDIVEISTDATLSDLTVDATTVDGFATDTYSYTVTLPYGTTDSPVVAGTATDDNATVSVVQASDVTSATDADRTATVTVTAEDGATVQDYTILFNVSTSNVNDIFANSISIYPNPSNGMFNIVVKENFNIEVFDIAGKVLQTKNANSNFTINIPNAGVYFIRFSNETGNTVKSVVVK